MMIKARERLHSFAAAKIEALIFRTPRDLEIRLDRTHITVCELNFCDNLCRAPSRKGFDCDHVKAAL
jgi:hypothetical protein